MEAFTGFSRYAMLGFFGSHIPITLCLDSQAALPNSWYPQFLLDLAQFEVDTFNDYLIGNAKNLPWFQSLICSELLFQVPYFFAAMYYIGDSSRKEYPDGFRAATIAYGASTATSLIPILATFWSAEYTGTFQERCVLTALYFPYFFVPAWAMWYAATSPAKSKKA